MTALFLCSMNRLRSPTAEHVARQLGFEADSAGIAHDADTVVTPEHIMWAEQIFVMENVHKSKLTKKYSHLLKDKKIIVLGIKDDYECMQPELIEILEKKLPHFLGSPAYITDISKKLKM